MASTSVSLPDSAPRPLRLVFLFGFVGLFAAMVMGRLLYWQVLQAAPLQKRIAAQHTMDDVVPAVRGSIYDSNGDLLAGNLSVDFVYAEPSQIKHPDEVAAALAPVVGTTPEELLPILSDQNRHYVRLLGGRKIPPEVSDQVRQLRLPGIFLEPTTVRMYPEKQLAAHVLGFVDGASQGWYGVEGQYNDLIGGKPGHLRAERDTAGNEIAFSDRQWQAPEDGLDVVLTLDRTIQYVAERELDRAIVQHKASGGSVLVMDVRTGALVAMASRPTFDPNDYQKWADQTAVFANPAVSLLYEPGSTFKIVTMAAALNERLVTPSTTYNDTGALSVGGYTIHNWDGKANGVTNMVQLLEKSSNIGASWVAFHLGKEKFYKYVTAFGFGQPTGVDLQGEGRGIVKNPNDKNWGEVDLATNSFGQAISVTPLQVITAVTAVANGGILMRPYIVKQVRDPHTGKVIQETQPQPERQVITRETAATLLKMLVSAVENGETHGMLVPGYHVAGKTGTASIPDLVNGGYDPQLTIASFVGAVPADDPQYVILVKIDKPTDDPWGSLIAKPAFGIIAQEITRYRGIRPTEPVPTATPGRPVVQATTTTATTTSAASSAKPAAGAPAPARTPLSPPAKPTTIAPAATAIVPRQAPAPAVPASGGAALAASR